MAKVAMIYHLSVETVKRGIIHIFIYLCLQPLAIKHDEHKTNIMNSKIRIIHNFTTNDPFIQLNIENGDNNDGALKHFVEQANVRGIEITYPKDNTNNSIVFIILKEI